MVNTNTAAGAPSARTRTAMSAKWARSASSRPGKDELRLVERTAGDIDDAGHDPGTHCDLAGRRVGEPPAEAQTGGGVELDESDDVGSGAEPGHRRPMH